MKKVLLLAASLLFCSGCWLWPYAVKTQVPVIQAAPKQINKEFAQALAGIGSTAISPSEILLVDAADKLLLENEQLRAEINAYNEWAEAHNTEAISWASKQPVLRELPEVKKGSK